MAAITIRAATVADAERLLPKARQVDIDEWVLATGKPVGPLLKDAIERATVARVAIHGKSGEPFAIWGTVPDPEAPDVGVLWSIGTDDMSTQGRTLQRYWAPEMALLHEAYPKIIAGVWERNAQHLKWLRAIGFKRLGPVKLAGAVTFIAWEREAV